MFLGHEYDEIEARSEEGCVSNERIPLHDQVPTVGLEEEESVEVSLIEPQAPLKPQVPPIP